jgi:hypothetical protein
VTARAAATIDSAVSCLASSSLRRCRSRSSLIYQIKQLEQTEISLEEAKLELVLLQQANKSLEASTCRSGVFVEQQRSVKDLVFGGADKEMVLCSDLYVAV